MQTEKYGGFGNLEVAGADDPPHRAGGEGRGRRVGRLRPVYGLQNVEVESQRVGAATPVEIASGGEGGRIGRRRGREREEAMRNGGGGDRVVEAAIAIRGGERMEHSVGWG